MAHTSFAVIASIAFRNFKVLRSAQVALGPFNLLIGPNGSGKSSMLLALQRLRNFAAKPAVFVTALPPLESVAGAGVRFRFAAPFSTVEAQMSCTPEGACSLLQVSGGADVREQWPALVARLASLRVVSLEQAALARPSLPGASVALGDDGANLPAALQRLQRDQPDAFARATAEFCRILPEYRAVKIVAAADGTRTLAAQLADEDKWLGPADLSQGTLALLGLLVLTLAAPVPAILCLEEIDRGIHPRLLRDIRDLLYRMSYPEGGALATQVLTTTHSPYLLDLFRDQLDEVIVAQKRGSEAGFERLSDRTDLRDSIGGASLGDLWYSGILGGVPDES